MVFLTVSRYHSQTQKTTTNATMKRKKSSDINIFNMSMLDVIFSALGAILILFLIVVTELEKSYDDNDELVSIVENQSAKLDQTQRDLKETADNLEEVAEKLRKQKQETEDLKDEAERLRKRANDIENKNKELNKKVEDLKRSNKKQQGNGKGEIPKPNCRVHFTGLVMGDEYVHGHVSKVYVVDSFSEYVGKGDYPDNSKAFPRSVQYTFDGIAIDKGTRLILYSGKNYSGDVLLNMKGPRIINNIIWQNDSRYAKYNTKTFQQPLQSNYPQSVRQWSRTDMHDWSYGSSKISCE